MVISGKVCFIFDSVSLNLLKFKDKETTKTQRKEKVFLSVSVVAFFSFIR